MGFKIDITGDIKGVLKEKTRKLIGEITDEINAFGQSTVNDAKRLAPIDEGHLRNSITYTLLPITKKSIAVEIVVAADYAAYIEFGTRKFAAEYVATLPKEWQKFAARFKGKGGGNFDDFVMRLTRWVMAKGISKRVGKQGKDKTAEADAYAIALYIMRNGIRKHPFLYPAIEKNRIELLKNIKALR